MLAAAAWWCGVVCLGSELPPPVLRRGAMKYAGRGGSRGGSRKSTGSMHRTGPWHRRGARSSGLPPGAPAAAAGGGERRCSAGAAVPPLLLVRRSCGCCVAAAAGAAPEACCALGVRARSERAGGTGAVGGAAASPGRPYDPPALMRLRLCTRVSGSLGTAPCRAALAAGVAVSGVAAASAAGLEGSAGRSAAATRAVRRLRLPGPDCAGRRGEASRLGPEVTLTWAWRCWGVGGRCRGASMRHAARVAAALRRVGDPAAP